MTEGYHGTIFAYGQTGSGKSFTMQGVSEPAAQRGVIPRAFEHIFESIQVGWNTCAMGRLVTCEDSIHMCVHVCARMRKSVRRKHEIPGEDLLLGDLQ